MADSQTLPAVPDPRRGRRGGKGLYNRSSSTLAIPGDNTNTEPRRRGPRKIKRLPTYLYKDEVDALLDHAPHPFARLLIVLCWRAGLRVAEALKLQWADVLRDVDGPAMLRVQAENAKSRKERRVVVHPELDLALRTAAGFKAHAAGEYIVRPWRDSTKSDGKPVAYPTALRWLREAEGACRRDGWAWRAAPEGVQGTHVLRHSAARHWLASRVPINVVKEWLGHSSLDQTMVYVQLVPELTGDTMQAVP